MKIIFLANMRVAPGTPLGVANTVKAMNSVSSPILCAVLSSVCIFVAVFVYMDLGLLSPHVLFALTSVLTFIGYVLFDVLDGGTLRCQSHRTSKHFNLILALCSSCG